MAQRIVLAVLPEYAGSALDDMVWLCGTVQRVEMQKEGLTYFAITGVYDGDPVKYEHLQYNWNTVTHEGEPGFGVLGFTVQNVKIT